MLKKYIEDNIILVIPSEIKHEVLREISKENNIYNIKFMNKEELIKSFTFSYDEKSIYYLIKNYDMNYDVAKMYLDNIKYVVSSDYDSAKLNKLKEIKEELYKNNLLIYDENIKEFIKNRKIVIYGYDFINKYDLSILEKIKEFTTVDIIDKKYENYEHKIYEFNHIDDEIIFVANKICDLINKGININNIKVSNVTSEYINVIDRIFNFYNIPINLSLEKSIVSSNIIYDFFIKLDESDINSSLEFITNKYDINNSNNLYIYEELLKLINKYNFVCEKDILVKILKNELTRIKMRKKLNQNAIEIIDIKNNNISNEDYVFLIGFNMGNIPYIYKDEDYITDSLKENLLLEKTKENNILEKEKNIKNIRGIKNLVITYKLKTNFDNYLPSQLVEYLNFEVIKSKQTINKYSNILNKILLTNKLDNLIKYGDKSDDLDILYSSYKDIPYLKYNNKFKGINKIKFNDTLNDKLLLSYSSIDNYNRCAFRYYLNNVLKITESEETFAQIIGSMFHEILSKAFEDGFDFEFEFNSFFKSVELTNKDKFFTEKLKEELKFIIDTINKQNSFSTFDKSLYENKIYINKEGSIKLTFMGIIDKLVYKEENDKTYLVIIDYKTGFPHINLNNVYYGIDMQLPVYLYLTKKGLFNNAEVVGFYLQKILNPEITKKKGKSYKKQKEYNLKLQGYTIDDETLVNKFDYTYMDSEVIKSLKFGQNGFYAYSKVISKEKVNELIKIVEDNIDKSFSNILDAKFDINPKRIGKDNVGCEFCKYKDICYMTEEDIVNLEEKRW